MYMALNVRLFHLYFNQARPGKEGKPEMQP